MKVLKVRCFSILRGKHLLSLCSGEVDGAKINSCHPQWRAGRCSKYKMCLLLFPQERAGEEKLLACFLKKPVSKLTKHDKTERADVFRRAAFKRCREIEISVKEV